MPVAWRNDGLLTRSNRGVHRDATVAPTTGRAAARATTRSAAPSLCLRAASHHEISSDQGRVGDRRNRTEWRSTAPLGRGRFIDAAHPGPDADDRAWHTVSRRVVRIALRADGVTRANSRAATSPRITQPTSCSRREHGRRSPPGAGGYGQVSEPGGDASCGRMSRPAGRCCSRRARG